MSAETGTILNDTADQATPSETPTQSETESTVQPGSDTADSTITIEGENLGEGYKYAGKYESLEAFEKGHKELVQKLTEQKPSAPEEYAFDFSENESLKDVKIEGSEDPFLADMLSTFKDANVTQDQANKIIESYYSKSLENKVDTEAELKKLGSEADEVIKSATNFVRDNFEESEQKILEAVASSAEGVKLLQKLSNMNKSQSIPTNAETVINTQSAQELMDEAKSYRESNPNFNVDRTAQAHYETLMDRAVKIQLKEQA